MEIHTDSFKKSLKVIYGGLWLNLFLSIFKFIAGMFGRSAAMIADAVHSLSDLFTDIVLIIGLKISRKPIDDSHDYGHGKYETLTALIIGVVLLLVGFEIAVKGTTSIMLVFDGGKIPIPGKIALYAAMVSILFKEILYRVTIKNSDNSQAIVANAWHHRSDVFSSIATLLGISGAIFLGHKWIILDPLAAVLVSLFIIKVGIDIVYSNLNQLMDGSLPKESEDKIIDIISKVKGVEKPHNLRTRKIGNRIAIDIHIRVSRSLNVVKAHDISTNVEKDLKSFFGEDTFVIVHVEPIET